MNILVTVASRHGSTLEIGEAIAAAIQSSGVDAEVLPTEAVATLDDYDAVVLGSGVYAGHWMRGARTFVDDHEVDLKGLPVWIFSSGPIGDPPTPMENPAEVAAISKRISARGHRLFAGKIDGSDLGLAERALIKLVRAPHGDYRSWSEISVWGQDIAATLLEPSRAPTTTTNGATA